MAKSIVKIFGATSTLATVAHMSDGQLTETNFEFDGRKSLKAVQVALRKQLNTTNFFIKSLEYSESEEQRIITMPLDVFLANAQPCEAGVQYPRTYVTATIKFTAWDVMSAAGIQTVTYDGITTESRARKIITDTLGDSNFLITATRVQEVRMFMERDKFEELGTLKNSAPDEESSEDSEE